MATPLTGIQRNGWVVAVMAGPVSQLDPNNSNTNKPSSSASCLKSSSPVRIFLFFHKAIRAELDALHRAAMAFAADSLSDTTPLLERYHFLRSIYKHHCNAEDEMYRWSFHYGQEIWRKKLFHPVVLWEGVLGKRSRVG